MLFENQIPVKGPLFCSHLSVVKKVDPVVWCRGLRDLGIEEFRN